MDYDTVVREAARSRQLLDANGRLKKLDSLKIVDFVVELERLSGLEIPTVELREDTFASLESIASLLRDLAEQAG